MRLSASPCETIQHYDSDGNMTQFGAWTYAYDSANRLSTISSNGVVLVANSYDAKGRRVRKATQNAATTFFYDGWNMVEERIVCTDGTASTIHYYWGRDLSGSLHGAGGVGGLLYLTVDGAIYVPTYDANGNVTRYLDATGATVASYAYDAFGRTVSAIGPKAPLFRHRFSTKYYDSETGLCYYGYRFCHPSLMRWLNRDPIEEDGGLNLYAFCGNNALCFIDPFGNDRYMTTFSIDPEKDQCHVGVAVDTWKCRNGRWQKTGIVTFEFLVDDSSWWKRAGRFVAVAKGIIVSRSGLNLVEPFALHSTPEQDIAMLNQMKSDQKNPPLYNAFFNNCIHWATKAIDYGMDR